MRLMMTQGHCGILREAFAVKHMPEQFKRVLELTVKMVNFLKSRAPNSRLFANICFKMGSEYMNFLLHIGLEGFLEEECLSDYSNYPLTQTYS